LGDAWGGIKNEGADLVPSNKEKGRFLGPAGKCFRREEHDRPNEGKKKMTPWEKKHITIKTSVWSDGGVRDF